MNQIDIPVAVGELIDKLTILEIKAERIIDETKLVNVHHELDVLTRAWQVHAGKVPDISALRSALKAVNEKLWDIEDAIRDKERVRSFDDEFIALARSVYRCNDERAAAKKAINTIAGSTLVEEKSYTDYGA